MQKQLVNAEKANSDGPTDERTDGPTDVAGYRVVCTRLKTESNYDVNLYGPEGNMKTMFIFYTRCERESRVHATIKRQQTQKFPKGRL